MINLSIVDAAIPTIPLMAQNPNTFILNLGGVRVIPIPSASKKAEPIPARDGAFQINLAPYESFSIEDEVFELLVDSAKGGESSFLSNLLYLIKRGVVQADHDGTVLTAKQVLNFVA